MRRQLRLFLPRRTASFLPFVVLVASLAGLVADTRADTAWETSAYKGWTVVSVKVTGLEGGLADEIKDGLALAYTHGFLGKNRATFYPQLMEEDIKRTRLFLARRGFPHARVSPAFEAQPLRQRVRVLLNVDPGPPVVVAGVLTQGLPPDTRPQFQRWHTLSAGSVFTDRRLEQVVASLDSLLAEQGFAHATVESRIAWEDSTHTTVVLTADPGPPCYFRDVFIEGADEDVVPLARKTANLKRGRRYSRSALEDAQENLRALDLFRQTRLRVEAGQMRDSLDVRVEVGMREFHTFSINGRYWSDDGLSGGLRWTHRNRFKRGRGRALIIYASGPEQQARYSVWWPAILWPRSRAIGSVGSTRESEEAYEVIDTGVTLSLRHEMSARTTLWVSTGFSNVNATNRSQDEPDVEKDDGLLTTLSFGVERNAGNHPVVPTRGTVTRLVLDWAPPGPTSDNHYVKGEGTVIVYAPLPLSTSVAGRVTLGLAKPTHGSLDMLPNKRFYSGGSNSMRGFHRRKLGPLDSGDAPLGGEAKLEVSVEYRFPLPWRFAGALFADGGQVWPSIDAITMDNLEVAVGTGLWLNTVVGPIRGDIARRVTDFSPSQPEWVFHFAVGPAF